MEYLETGQQWLRSEKKWYDFGSRAWKGAAKEVASHGNALTD